MDDENELLIHQEPQLFSETPIYKEAITHFRLTYNYYILFSLIKISTGIGLLFRKQNYSYLNLWIASIIIHSLIMITIYLNHLKYLTMNRRNLAYKLDQITALPINDQQYPFIDQRRLSILTRQIKLEIIKLTVFGKWTCRIIIFLYQILFGYGVYLFWIYYNEKTGEILYQYLYLCLILAISLYQYIDFYLIAMLAILGSPFLIIFACYYCANLCAKEQIRNETRSRLQSIKYKPNQIEGDPECTICRCPYELNENVVILRCSKLHHFHESCILSWININNTCPLCRKDI